MKIVTRIGGGRTEHAAKYNPDTGEIILFCDSLKYPAYFAAITDPTEPTPENVTCKKCLKNKPAWQKGSESMFKIIYFEGPPLEFSPNIKLPRLIETAERNPNVYQIIHNNRDQKVLWEREAPGL